MKNVALILIGMSLSLFTSNAQASDVYQQIFNNVNQGQLIQVLKDMTGSNTVKVGSDAFRITNRYSATAKAEYRKYWTNYFQSLGMAVQEFTYNANYSHTGESVGHNLEAVLPGLSPDSIVIIVHYDSIGPSGRETGNPGVDDDMTGMAVSLETARLLAPFANRLKYTIRFVAADHEELGGLKGAREYAKYISALSKSQNFKIVTAIDNEQSGWNCGSDRKCGASDAGKIFDVFSCASASRYNYSKLGDALASVASQYSTLKVKRACMGNNSDHYAMWEIGVPAVVYSEHNPFDNPHFDQNGNDTFERIDQDYFFRIAQIGVTFAAKIAGLPESFEGTAPLNLMAFFQ